MADINQTITLGIGTPAGVPEFLTLGLQIGTVSVPEVPGMEWRADAPRLHWRSDAPRLHWQDTETQ